MVRRSRVLTAALTAAVCAGLMSAPSAAHACATTAVITGCVDADNDGNSTRIGGTSPGSTSPPQSGGSDSGSDADKANPSIQPDDVKKFRIGDDPTLLSKNECLARATDGINSCTRVPRVDIGGPGGSGGPPAVPMDVSDLAEFQPAAPEVRMQPSAWMLRDAHTNFIARSEQHIIAGTLFGQPTEVRYSPVRYHFDYGDGSPVRSSEWGGASWEDQGLREFDETTTSHIYTKRGEHTASVATEFTAEYRISGGPWLPVTGTVRATTNHSGRTVTIDTVLVAGPCSEYPNKPGCPGYEYSDAD